MVTDFWLGVITTLAMEFIWVLLIAIFGGKRK
jgi:hypothetical protein